MENDASASADTSGIVSADKIAAVDLHSLLAGVSDIRLYELHKCLSDAAESANESDAAVLKLLSDFTYCYLTASDSTDPYKAVMVFGDCRTKKPTDIADEQILEVSKVVPRIPHLGLRAHLADIVWLTNRKLYNFGILAVQTICSIVKRLDDAYNPDDNECDSPVSYDAVETLRRACVISRSINWNRSEFSNLKDAVAQLVDRSFKRRDILGFQRIAKLALTTGTVDAIRIAEQAETMTGFPEIQSEPRRREQLWNLASTAFGTAGDVDEKNRCEMLAAECIREDAMSRTDSSLAQSVLLKSALKKLRQIPGTRSRQREVYQELREIQPEIPSEMKNFIYKIDVKEAEHTAIEQVSKGTLLDAIFVLFGCVEVPDPSTMVIEALKETRLVDTVSNIQVDDRGDFTYSAKCLDGISKEESERVLHKISIQRNLERIEAVTKKIDPIRRAISSRFYVDEDMLLPFFGLCPLVPSGHEFLFARGMRRFLGGEDIDAACILVPQLEGYLRHILECTGIDTTTMHDEGYQAGAALGKMFGKHRKQLEMAFPDNVLFEIEMLFNYRGGPLLRNKIAHAEMETIDMLQPIPIYGCWFIMHIAACIIYSKRDQFKAELEPLNVTY